MKIQCSCGTKYAFDVTVDMVRNPIQFICQNCQADNSATVNQLIQQQFGAVVDADAAAAVPAPSPAPRPVSLARDIAAPSAPPPPPVPPAPPLPGQASSMRVHVQGTSAAAQRATAEQGEGAKLCGKHPGQAATEKCLVCAKPMCPKCMELFGYVCSPYCKNEAESRRIHVPVYARQASAVQAAGWRHFRLVSWSVVASIFLLVGIWCWYEFSLSKPKPVFAVRFDDAAESGNARFINDQVAIVLRGGRLIRYDVKGKKELWHAELLDKNEIAQKAAKAAADSQAVYDKMKNDKSMGYSAQELRPFQPVNAANVAAELEKSDAADMHLHVRDKNVWVRTPEKMVRYDLDSGKAAQEVKLDNGYMQRVIKAEDSLVILSSKDGAQIATRVDLTSGQTQVEEIEAARASRAALDLTNGTNRAVTLAKPLGGTNKPTATPTLVSANTRGTATGGKQTATGQQNPALKQFKTQREASFAEKIASPAMAANTVHNAQLEKAMAEDEVARSLETYGGKVVMDGNGKFIQFNSRLVEEKIIKRQAMKAASSKSALDGDVNQAATTKIANEIFNDFQRESTGGFEEEDASRYEVTLKRLGAQAVDWTGEVIGRPDFFALKTVNLVVAGKSLHVFDSTNRKLWETKLNYEIGAVGDSDDEYFGPEAGAPGVERDRRLYFRDQGVLTCFDLATGHVHWRLPSVGVAHLLFDDKGMLYAETTTASADKLKYSQEVDISRKDHPQIVKIDPSNGKILWKSENNGRLAQISGKLIYTLEWQGGVETGEDNPYAIPGAYVPPHVRIRRLSPSTGKVMWEHYERRGPLDVKFRDNQIEILFRKEFQVLRFWTL